MKSNLQNKENVSFKHHILKSVEFKTDIKPSYEEFINQIAQDIVKNSMKNIIYNEKQMTYLMCGDCLELMKTIPDRTVDMILCDLPYGTTACKWDNIIPFEPLWEQYKRIIKDNGAIVLFCDGLFTANLIQSNANMWRYNMVWDKQRGCDFLNANVKPLKCHEDIAVFYKKKPIYNKQFWYSAPYKPTKNGSLSDNYRDRKEAWSESDDGKRNPLTILSFKRDGNRLHPTQKPVALLEYLIKTYTNEGETVLDNCMGSGSTGVACVNTNRNFIGIELDENYFNIAKSRIEEAEKGTLETNNEQAIV